MLSSDDWGGWTLERARSTSIARLAMLEAPPYAYAAQARLTYDTTFVSGFGSTILGKTLNPRKTERQRGGEDRAGFVRDESTLDRKCDMERSSGHNGGRSMESRCPLRKTVG